MFSLDKSSFTYTVTARVSHVPDSTAAKLFPGVGDIILTSRVIDSYIECADSCKALMDHLAADMSNASDVKYVVVCETSPYFGGENVRSEDWHDNEIARLWIYNADFETKNANIEAIAQSSIRMARREYPVSRFN